MSEIQHAEAFQPEKARDDSPAQLTESYAPEKMSAGRYIATRFSTLKPPMHKAPNPIILLRSLNRQQWAFFAVAFIAWVSCVPLDGSADLILK
jgi:hypothetical protein